MQTGKSRETGNLAETFFFQMHIGCLFQQIRDEGKQCNANAGYILGDNRCLCGSGDTPFKTDHKPQVQDNVKSGGDGEKYQWYYGISQRPKQRCEKIVEKDSGESCKDHDQILMHQSF